MCEHVWCKHTCGHFSDDASVGIRCQVVPVNAGATVLLDAGASLRNATEYHEKKWRTAENPIKKHSAPC